MDTGSSWRDDHTDIMSIMKSIEEEYECSGGFCHEDDVKDFLPIYVFSNVNDGIPNKSCHGPVQDIIMSNLNMYYYGFLIPYILSIVVICGYSLILLTRVWNFCCRFKKKKQNDKRRQAGRRQREE
mmetsp:Transcript_41951/g.64234  ORF Transcript_41951/g.64234 Transcript_41951/m.64234 type:complete len:126 (+) Transcript_41951:686-1063(+)